MLNTRVRAFWEREACGTAPTIVGDVTPYTRAWFDRIEAHRYQVEPFIHEVAQFARHRGHRVLEVGVSAGTDHLQWARAGARSYGVDLTRTALLTTQHRLSLYGFDSGLQQADAESLPFADAAFDLVYSWGVIHHAARPDLVVREIHRVLKPGGAFVGMMYGRHSPVALKVWVRQALLRGRPWRTLSDVLWHHMESVGTKAYTVHELRRLFAAFGTFSAAPRITPYDTSRWPAWVARRFPDRLGWFIVIRATK